MSFDVRAGEWNRQGPTCCVPGVLPVPQASMLFRSSPHSSTQLFTKGRAQRVSAAVFSPTLGLPLPASILPHPQRGVKMRGKRRLKKVQGPIRCLPGVGIGTDTLPCLVSVAGARWGGRMRRVLSLSWKHSDPNGSSFPITFLPRFRHCPKGQGLQSP